MDSFFRLVHPWIFFGSISVILLVAILRCFFYRRVVYRYSMGSLLASQGFGSSHPRLKIFFIIRLLLLIFMALLMSRPQKVDTHSKITVEGIDIMLVLDVSGSMAHRDNSDDRSRIEIAKQEAIRFIEKRVEDSIGLVIFAQEAFSRCPVTFDRELLKNMVNELQIGIVNEKGTKLAMGAVTAANRLKYSKAKTKIIILLTDGEPTEGDLDPAMAIEVAKKMGIKIYTIGIGSDKDELFFSPMIGMLMSSKVNDELLKKMAHETGGQFFMAHNARDMRAIYDTIDTLEKTKQETPLFSNYQEYIIPGALLLMMIVVIDSWLSAFVWFGI